MPKQQLQALFEGYLDSDGCVINGKMQFSTVNRQMAYGFSAIINKLYHRAVSFNKTKVKPQKVIQGRIVNQRDYYLLRFNPKNSKQDKAFYENVYIWYPFNKIEQGEDEFVFNMEIENDHSYIVQSCISKNCQDLSAAGLGKGMERGSGTRSGMLWEVERLLKETKELPQVLLMENVKQVIGQKNIKAFAEWIAFLDKLGYHSKWQVINATDFSIPQNRERCFMVSVLGNHYYEFPKVIGNKLKLKDVLEKKVADRYYLKETLVDYFIKHTEESIEKKNGFRFAPTSGGGDWQSHNNKSGKQNGRQLHKGVVVSKCGKVIERETDIAMTLMARDYKGFGNQSTTGVLEWIKKK